MKNRMTTTLALALLGLSTPLVAQQNDTQGALPKQTLQQEQPLAIEPSETDRQQRVTTRNGVLQITDTIRGVKEQPKVLSIVPWRPPSEKAALPSPFIQRIEQDFAPLVRQEFIRQVEHFDRLSEKK